jgi:hypothetical protein
MAFLLFPMFSLQQVLLRRGWWGKVSQTMYTHVNKCKNKIKGEKQKKKKEV